MSREMSFRKSGFPEIWTVGNPEGGIQQEQCLIRNSVSANFFCMAKKTKIAPTKEYPLPPAREGTKDLGVDVADSIAHRIKLARYHLDVKCGVTITKRTTVEELLRYALDAFDENPELVFAGLFERSAA